MPKPFPRPKKRTPISINKEELEKMEMETGDYQQKILDMNGKIGYTLILPSL